MEEFIEEAFDSFPLPFVLVLGGYAFILLLDKVLISSHTHSNEEGHSSSEGTQSSHLTTEDHSSLDNDNASSDDKLRKKKSGQNVNHAINGRDSQNPFNSLSHSPLVTQPSTKTKPGKLYSINDLVDPFRDFEERE